MKSAFEISMSPIFDIATRSGILRVEFEREIKKIQLDAMKEGMKRAANNPVCDAYEKQAILTASEQLTEKDL